MFLTIKTVALQLTLYYILQLFVLNMKKYFIEILQPNIFYINVDCQYH